VSAKERDPGGRKYNYLLEWREETSHEVKITTGTATSIITSPCDRESCPTDCRSSRAILFFKIQHTQAARPEDLSSKVRHSVGVSGDPGHEVLERSVVGESLDTNTITLDLADLLESHEFGHGEGGEAVLTGDEHTLATSELEAGAAESLLSEVNVSGLGSDGHKNLIDGNASGLDVGLTESTTHTLLESISSSAGQHLVDTDSVPGVDTDSHGEGVLGGLGDHVFVGSDTG